MKSICTLILAFLFVINLVEAQDTMYVYRSGAVLSRHAVNEIDSIVFRKALKLDTVYDVENNAYKTITIGTQTWMVENLKTTHYNDGTTIPIVSSGTTWSSIKTPAYCYYNNDVSKKSQNGVLYNWFAVNTGKLAPIGWHVPTDAEWITLRNYLIENGYGYGGSGSDIVKSMASTYGWNPHSTPGMVGNEPHKNNSSGFTALSSGYRDYTGKFLGFGYDGHWWSATQSDSINAWYQSITYHDSDLVNYNHRKQNGFSIRCIKNADTQVRDIDGNVYNTIKIGNQTWMVENLKTTKFKDGTTIPFVRADTSWSTSSSPGYCYYSNDSTKKDVYGNLYNWFAVNSGKLAPIGWHVPSDAEWTTLENYLISNEFNYDGTPITNKIAKSLAETTEWNSSSVDGAIGNDLTKNNKSGFSALPNGYRTNEGLFNGIGKYGVWWSVTSDSPDAIWGRGLFYNNASMGRDQYPRRFGFSIRCLKDNEPILLNNNYQ